MGPRETNLNILQEEILQQNEAVNLRLVKSDTTVNSEKNVEIESREGKPKRTHESAMAELGELLELYEPKKWSPSSIRTWNRGLYEYLGKMIKKKILTWEDIGKISNGQYENSFQFIYLPDWTLESAVEKIKKIIVENKSASFRPKDIRVNHGLYNFLIEQIRNGKISWEEIAIQVKADLGAEFSNRDWEIKKRRTFDDAMNELNSQLTLNCPEKITPTYINKHIHGKYKYFRKYITKDNGEIDWDRIRQALSPDLMEKFSITENLTMEKVIRRISEGLKIKNPQVVSPDYLKREFPSDVFFLAKNCRDTRGHIDWRSIVGHPLFDSEMRKKFKFPVSINRNIPIETYSNSEEVEEILKEKEKNLYTFIESINKEDLEKRNEICLLLVELAQKGNSQAEKKLIDLISYTVEQWIDRIPSIRNFKFYKEKKYEIIKRCIYNYKKDKPFVGYVYASFKKANLGLEKMKEVEFFEDR
ncbi:MAG: hypothetical protein ACD_56C00042G0004 [uncultured bacterium]|nr:MAG: hypothetical protein ACD_56C00042G0004 [uncultured bacterium]